MTRRRSIRPPTPSVGEAFPRISLTIDSIGLQRLRRCNLPASLRASNLRAAHLGVEETSLRIRRSSLFGAGAAGVVLAVSALLLGPAAPAAAASFPVQPNIATAALAAAVNPE